MTKMKKHIKKILQDNIQKKLHVKHKTEFCDQNNLIYYCKCPNQTCRGSYIG